MEKISWNRKRIEADAQEARSRGAGGKFINMKDDGSSVIGRFLPVAKPRKGVDAELYVRYGQHYVRDMELYIICLNQPVVSDVLKAAGLRWTCGFCERWKDLRSSKDQDDQEAAGDYTVSIRYMSNFHVKDDPITEVKILRYSGKTQPKIVDLAFGPDYPDVLELADGRDVKITRKGTGLDTDYTPLPQKGTYDLDEEVLDGLNDLYAELDILQPKLMERVMKGVKPAEDEFVTLRSIASGTADAPPKGKGAKGKDKDEDDKVEKDADGDPVPTKSELRALNVWAAELEVEIDGENGKAAIEEALVTEAVGTKVKSLSANFLAWLEEQGCDVSGRLVESPEPPKEGKGKGKDADADDVDAELAAIRARRAGKKK